MTEVTFLSYRQKWHADTGWTAWKMRWRSMKTGGYIWLDYYQPRKEDLTLLVEPLGLHPLSIEDCIDENQIPKIDDYPTQHVHPVQRLPLPPRERSP